MLLALAALGAVCQARAAGGISLSSVPLGSDDYLGRYINSDRPGELYFLEYAKSLMYSAKFGTDIVGFEASDDGRLLPLRTDISREHLDEVICITEPSGFLCVANARSGKRRDVYFSTMGRRGGGDSCLFLARDEYTGKELLSEPTERLPMYYNEEHGLSIFNYYSANRVVVRRHKRDLSGPDYVLADVTAHGRGFIDGRITHVFVCGDGTVHRFDPAAVKLAEAKELGWLAALNNFALMIATDGDPAEFVFTRSMLAADTSDNQVLLLTSAGVQHRIAKRDEIKIALDGSARTAKQLELIDNDKRLLGNEGRRAGPEFVDQNCQLIAVDDSRLAVFDAPYQRVVFCQ